MTFKTQQLFFLKKIIKYTAQKIKGTQIWSLWIKNSCKQSLLTHKLV